MVETLELRAAIAPHRTPVTDEGAWDGPANEARLRADEEPAYYRRAYAAQRPDTDGTAKAHYGFIHHVVGSDGDIGAAHVRGCQTGIAVLNGARVPSLAGVWWREFREGIWSHLAGHLRDADVEPAPLRSLDDIERDASGPQVEIRTYPLDDVELRQAAKGPGTLVGHAAIYNALSEELWPGVREIIRPGAFDASLNRGDEVVALFNHDVSLLLGRRSAGTLRLREDDRGLVYEIMLPDTTAGRDVATLVARGDLRHSSFAFIPELVRAYTQGISEVVRARLLDVSPVVYPAYPQTDVTLARMARLLETVRCPVETPRPTDGGPKAWRRWQLEVLRLRGRKWTTW